jgi:hypothetical protein
MGRNSFLGDNMIHTDEDDEFDRIERENAMKGQPYHFDIFVSPSQRNQVLEECAKLADQSDLPVFAKTIRERKK